MKAKLNVKVHCSSCETLIKENLAEIGIPKAKNNSNGVD